jgi:hypothetical protein
MTYKVNLYLTGMPSFVLPQAKFQTADRSDPLPASSERNQPAGLETSESDNLGARGGVSSTAAYPLWASIYSEIGLRKAPWQVELQLAFLHLAAERRYDVKKILSQIMRSVLEIGQAEREKAYSAARRYASQMASKIKSKVEYFPDQTPTCY